MKKIFLMDATGEAATELAAFDNALVNCGIGNYNLIRLSSVIPPYSKINKQSKLPDTYGVWGDRLYVVYAYMSASQPGEQAWAGIGWVKTSDNGAGLFVEHEAASETHCRELLQASLSELCRSRNLDMEEFEHDYQVIGVTCKKNPVAALVTAVFEADGWRR